MELITNLHICDDNWNPGINAARISLDNERALEILQLSRDFARDRSSRHLIAPRISVHPIWIWRMIPSVIWLPCQGRTSESRMMVARRSFSSTWTRQTSGGLVSSSTPTYIGRLQ